MGNIWQRLSVRTKTLVAILAVFVLVCGGYIAYNGYNGSFSSSADDSIGVGRVSGYAAINGDKTKGVPEHPLIASNYDPATNKAINLTVVTCKRDPLGPPCLPKGTGFFYFNGLKLGKWSIASIQPYVDTEGYFGEKGKTYRAEGASILIKKDGATIKTYLIKPDGYSIVELKPGELIIPFREVMVSGVNLTGKVTAVNFHDRSKTSPAVGLTVKYYDTANPSDLKTTQTDASGNYTLSGLQAGKKYRARLFRKTSDGEMEMPNQPSTPGANCYLQDLTGPDNILIEDLTKTPEEMFVVDASVLTGKVYDASKTDRPLTSAEVGIFYGEWDTVPGLTQTGTDFHFCIRNGKTYKIQATPVDTALAIWEGNITPPVKSTLNIDLMTK